MRTVFAPRYPWPMDFPDVIIHSELAVRNRHAAYDRAKAGNAEAAIVLVRDLLNDEALVLLQQTVGQHDVILAAVSAIEKTGFNAIPDAMEHEIGKRLGLSVDTGDLLQVNKVAHTRATGWHRLVTPPLFGGEVTPGRNYVLLDDHIGLGGTLANMRGYIEAGGGKVVAMSTLTESRAARKIAASPETIDMLRSKHGQELEIFWQETFGYDLDCLTEVEASYLARQSSFDAIRANLAEAAEEAGSSGLSAISF